MPHNRRILVLVVSALSTLMGVQDGSANAKTFSPRVFIHSRGESSNQPFLESWKVGDTTYFQEAGSGKSYNLLDNTLLESTIPRPALTGGWQGVMKRRKGAWWFLRFERGHLPETRRSELYRYDTAVKTWILTHRLEIRASNFELLDGGHFLLFGIHDPSKGRYHLAGTLSGDSSAVSLLDEAPIRKWFADRFWASCITSLDDRMAYVYFPLSGHLIGYDLESHSLKEFQAPWPLISDESIEKNLDAAKSAGKPDCFISAVGHPSPQNCYFLPIPGGQMGFVYKVLDEEEEKRSAFADGTRPVIEKAAAFMLVPDDPHMLIELTPPSRTSLERLAWSTTANRLVRWDYLKAPGKKPSPASAQKPSGIKPDLRKP